MDSQIYSIVSCTEPDWDDDADSWMELSTSCFDAEVSYLLLDVEEKAIFAACVFAVVLSLRSP